jgi:hypothetical protein
VVNFTPWPLYPWGQVGPKAGLEVVEKREHKHEAFLHEYPLHKLEINGHGDPLR